MRENRFNGLLFKRGFLATGRATAGYDSPYYEHVLASWRTEPFGDLVLHHDPSVTLHRHEGEGVVVALLGFAVDPVNGYADTTQSVKRLHSSFLRSEDAFFDYLDLLTGRFVLFVKSHDRSFVLQDAAGTRTLFYDTSQEEPLLSSHVALLALLTDRDATAAARELMRADGYVRGFRHFPGVTTPYEGIRALTPNTLLTVPGNRVERFFPRKPLEARGVTEVLVDELAGLFLRQAELLSQTHGIAISLTGGVDSRLTLAAALAAGSDVTCFTYVESETDRRDAELAADLCGRAGVEYSAYPVDRSTCGLDLEEYLEVWRLSTASMRADSQGMISKVLFDRYPAGRLHLKSNVSEVARGAFRRTQAVVMPYRINPDTFAKLFGIEPESRFVRDSFRQYLDIVEFSQESTFNYDIYELFHWEYQQGTWQSLQVMDFDTCLETAMLYNNRYVLTRMLGVPFRDRLAGTLHFKMMERLRPELLETPFFNDMKPPGVNAAKSLVKNAKYRAERALTARKRRPAMP